MMRENESDGAGGWWQSPGEAGPRAPRDQDRDEGARRPGPDAAPPPEDGYPDTITFASPAGPGDGNQGDHGHAWYGNQDGYPGQGGYG